MSLSLPEVWLRGPVQDIPPLLQPVAHALMQARDEVSTLMRNFPDELLWQRPAGLASPAFHLRHLAGVLDRLLTYARDEPLSRAQLVSLSQEGEETPLSAASLVQGFERQVAAALLQLQATPEDTLTDPRGVGRDRLPSTVVGLLVHAAEHSMRHVGQLLVTTRVLQETASRK